MNLITNVILRSQFHNIWEGVKEASLTYKTIYNGDDKEYRRSYEQELIHEVARQTDFWDCVMGFNESYSVEVKVMDTVENKAELEKRLTNIILEDLKERTGKNPEDSFEDKMTTEEKEEIERGVAWVRRNYPGLGD